MSFRIQSIELYVRETPPGRMAFSLGKKGAAGDVKKGLINPLGHVRMVLRDSAGNETFGCSGDRLSVRWLDKRPGRSQDRKRRELVALIETARDIWLNKPDFDSPFARWRACHEEIMRAGRKADQEDLTSSFASALFERAMLDGVCRLSGKPIFEMVKEDRLGFRPGEVHRELAGVKFPQIIRSRPLTEIAVRHTVGASDPLTDAELPDEKRVNDGLPETLAEYIRVDGVRHFKVKISGAEPRDFERLERVWDVVLAADTPVITLDANEAYADLQAFARFVDRLERQATGLFQHIAYIEQPLPRTLSLDRQAAKLIRRIGEKKPLIIDESDGTLDAFKRALAAGYLGVSHKNCKGFFKSLLNHGLVVEAARRGKDAFLSGEDLQNLPVVPLHQDFAAVALLGLEHCERNGHHYNYGLALLSEKDKANAVRRHPDMYVRRGKEWFLRIEEGKVRCASLQCPGFGVQDDPDWKSMEKMRKWVERRHPA